MERLRQSHVTGKPKANLQLHIELNIVITDYHAKEVLGTPWT
jgi:hypothetical protein